MKYLMTFVLGGLFGAIAGLLFAPKTGRKTRKDVQDKLNAQMLEIEKNFGEQSKEWFKKYNHVIDELSAKGKKILEEAGQKVKAQES